MDDLGKGTVLVFDTKAGLNRAFTERIKDIATKKQTVTIALSGGSTPQSLFEYWARLPDGEVEWSKFRFFWGDERCVPPSDGQSNYKMAKELFFDRVEIAGGAIFRIRGENDPEQEARRYGELLDRELDKPDGIPSFDILMLGMGDDGHTASIFPQEMELWNSPQNCVVGTHPTTGQKRVSLSGKVINAAKNIFFLVTGQNKAEKVKEIMEYPHEAEKKYPAALVHPVAGNLCWLLDKGATELLREKGLPL